MLSVQNSSAMKPVQGVVFLVLLAGLISVEGRIFLIPRKWFFEGMDSGPKEPIVVQKKAGEEIPEWEKFEEGKLIKIL